MAWRPFIPTPRSWPDACARAPHSHPLPTIAAHSIPQQFHTDPIDAPYCVANTTHALDQRMEQTGTPGHYTPELCTIVGLALYTARPASRRLGPTAHPAPRPATLVAAVRCNNLAGARHLLGPHPPRAIP